MPSIDHVAGRGWNATVSQLTGDMAIRNSGNRKNMRNLRYACGINRQFNAAYSMNSQGLIGVQNGMYPPMMVPSTGNRVEHVVRTV